MVITLAVGLSRDIRARALNGWPPPAEVHDDISAAGQPRASGNGQAAIPAAADDRPGHRRGLRPGRVRLGVLPGPRQGATGTSPPPLTVLTPDTGGGNGDIFIAPGGGGYPAGPEIVTTTGKVVWFHRLPAGDVATDFRTQTYRGRPVLTWFQSGGQGVQDGPGGPGGRLGPTGPTGTDYIYNDRYQEIATVRAGNGDVTNFHEFLITPWDTALILVDTVTTANLTSIGGPADQRVIDGLVQEIDIRTGRVLFQWDSAAYVPYGDSYAPRPPPRARPGTGSTSTPSTSTPMAICW